MLPDALRVVLSHSTSCRSIIC